MSIDYIKADQTILHGPHVSYEYLIEVLYRRNIAKYRYIAITYTVFGELTQIGNLLPIAQAIHETAWFTSERWLKSNNPAGIGATNDGAWGGEFASVSEGVIAQYAHLLAYAVSKPNYLQQRLMSLDTRLDIIKQYNWQGKSPKWTDLNGKWASPGRTYGQSIVKKANELLKAIK